MLKHIPLIVCLLLAGTGIAASPTVYPAAPEKLLSTSITDLIPIPTSTSIVTSTNAWITGIVLVGASSGSTIHVTATCNTSGNPFLNATGIAITTLYPVAFQVPVYCIGGFSISADGAGAYYQVGWKQ